MKEFEIAIALTKVILIISIASYLRLNGFGKTSYSNVTFDNDDNPSKLSYDYMNQLLKQQRWAFGLLWVSIVLSMIFGTVLVSRLIFSPTIDLGLIGEGVAIACSLTLGVGAKKFYTDTSSRVEKILQIVIKKD